MEDVGEVEEVKKEENRPGARPKDKNLAWDCSTIHFSLLVFHFIRARPKRKQFPYLNYLPLVKFCLPTSLLFATVWLLTAFGAKSQNLIANPGFERIFTDAEYQWVQPQGPYYHYEITDSSTAHQARTGLYVNGLCMYYGEPNEYLHVKLLEPLEQGERYVIDFYAQLMRAKCLEAYRQKLIGVHLGRKRLDTHVPGDLYLKPQINLSLPDSGRFDWFYLSDTLTAEGGERYLTLGYFAATQVEEDRAKIAAQRKAEWERKYAPRDTAKKEDMAWLYLPPDEQAKYIKARKKEQKKAGKKNKEKKGKAVDSPFAKPEASWQSPLDGVAYEDLPGYFSVRYYFDDFCLAKLDDNGELDCSLIGADVVWAEGSDIALQNVFFNTDSDELLDESLVQLNALLEVMEARADMKIELRGFTDNRGDSAHNLDLSQRRATSVLDWLVSRGVDRNRLSARGFGDAQPIADNDTQAGRARNRRVDFTIRSL